MEKKIAGLIGAVLSLLMTSGTVAADWSVYISTSGTGYLDQYFWVEEDEYEVSQYTDIEDGTWDFYLDGSGNESDFELNGELDASGEEVYMDMVFDVVPSINLTTGSYAWAENSALIEGGMYTWRDTSTDDQGIFVYGPGLFDTLMVQGDEIDMGTWAYDEDEGIEIWGYIQNVNGAVGAMGAWIEQKISTKDLDGSAIIAVWTP